MKREKLSYRRKKLKSGAVIETDTDSRQQEIQDSLEKKTVSKGVKKK